MGWSLSLIGKTRKGVITVNAKMKKTISALLSVCFCLACICFVPDVSVKTSADDSVIDLGTVFKEWVNYPDKSYGAGYSAGWGYNASS